MINIHSQLAIVARNSIGPGLLETSSEYWVSKLSDGQSLTGQRGLVDFENGSTSTSDANDCVYLDYVSSSGNYLYFPGTSGNNITVTNPVASADIVITYSDDSTDSSLTAQTSGTLTFGDTDVLFSGLKVKSIQIKNNAGGAEVGLWEASLSSQTAQTDSYSNVFSVNHSATGLFSVLVNSDTGSGYLANGVDNYIEAASNAAWGIDAAGDTTWIWRGLMPDVVINARHLMANTNGEGVILRTHGTNLRFEGRLQNTSGTTFLNETSGDYSFQVSNIAITVNSGTISMYINGVLVDSDTRDAGLYATGILRLFARGGGALGQYQRGFFSAALIHKDKTYSASEITQASAQLKALNNTDTPSSGAFSDDFSTDPASRWNAQTGSALTWNSGDGDVTIPASSHNAYTDSQFTGIDQWVYAKFDFVVGGASSDEFFGLILRGNNDGSDTYAFRNNDGAMLLRVINGASGIADIYAWANPNLNSGDYMGYTVKGTGTGTEFVLYRFGSTDPGAFVSQAAWQSAAAENIVINSGTWDTAPTGNYADTGLYTGIYNGSSGTLDADDFNGGDWTP